MTTAHPELEGLGNYEYGWSDKSTIGDNAKRGLNEDVVRDISSKKSEPQWMLDLRLKGLSLFDKKPMPNWGSDLSGIFFDQIKYFVRSTEKQAATWEDLPDEIKNTYDRLGIPEAEKQRLVSLWLKLKAKAPQLLTNLIATSSFVRMFVPRCKNRNGFSETGCIVIDSLDLLTVVYITKGTAAEFAG